VLGLVRVTDSANKKFYLPDISAPGSYEPMFQEFGASTAGPQHQPDACFYVF
jgi:hypothetical protein